MLGGKRSMALTFAADLSDSDGLKEDESRLQDEIDIGGDVDEQLDATAARWRLTFKSESKCSEKFFPSFVLS